MFAIAAPPLESRSVEGQATAVLSLARSRFGLIPSGLAARIETAEPEALETMLHALLDATTLENWLSHAP
jgi:hypothetical protein